jgi:hypothetical protein
MTVAVVASVLSVMAVIGLQAGGFVLLFQDGLSEDGAAWQEEHR